MVLKQQQQQQNNNNTLKEEEEEEEEERTTRRKSLPAVARVLDISKKLYSHEQKYFKNSHY